MTTTCTTSSRRVSWCLFALVAVVLLVSIEVSPSQGGARPPPPPPPPSSSPEPVPTPIPCPAPFQRNSCTGECTDCIADPATACNGLAFGLEDDCETCDCVPCSHGGTLRATTGKEACLCDCPNEFPSVGGGDCNECPRDSRSCHEHGWLDPSDCATCHCQSCAHGGTPDDHCRCECASPWTNNDINTDCTVHEDTPYAECDDDADGPLEAGCSFCTRGGQLDPATGCTACICPTCGQAGSTTNDDCSCECEEKYGKNARGECVRCLLDDNTFCNSRGWVNDACDGCFCEGCGHGRNAADCECKCEEPWQKDGEGACTVCLPSWECGEEERLDLDTCACVTCATDCDDKDECTSDACVSAECVHVLLPECDRCFGIDQCDECGTLPQCEWVKCDDPGLVLIDGHVVRLQDLEVEAVAEEREKLRAARCDLAHDEGDEEMEFRWCNGYRMQVCREEICRDNTDRIFAVCELDQICPEAEVQDDQVFYIRFCIEGADGTLGDRSAWDSTEWDSDTDGTDDTDDTDGTADNDDTDETDGTDDTDDTDDTDGTGRRRWRDRRRVSSGDEIDDEDDPTAHTVEVTIDGVTMEVSDVAEKISKGDMLCVPRVLNTTGIGCTLSACHGTDDEAAARQYEVPFLGISITFHWWEVVASVAAFATATALVAVGVHKLRAMRASGESAPETDQAAIPMTRLDAVTFGLTDEENDGSSSLLDDDGGGGLDWGDAVP